MPPARFEDAAERPVCTPGSPRCPELALARQQEGAGRLRSEDALAQGARRAGDARGEHRHPADDADPGHRLLCAASAGRARGLRRQDHRPRAREATGPHRPGRGPARLRGGGSPGACGLLADAVTGRRCRARSWASARINAGEHPPGGSARRSPAMASAWRSNGRSSRRGAAAPRRAGGIASAAPPRTRSRHPRPGDQRGVEGVHGRQAGVPAARRRRRPRGGIAAVVRAIRWSRTAWGSAPSPTSSPPGAS